MRKRGGNMGQKRLKMYGGVYGGLIPIGILLVGLVALSVAGMGGSFDLVLPP